jgi:ribonuclease-3
MMTDLRAFFKQFKIEINNLDIFQEAVTHNSFSNESTVKKSYENLEFLGDAVLQLKSSIYLYNKFKDSFNMQGELTNGRQCLVCEDTLAHIGTKIGIGNILRLGHGEEQNGGRTNSKILGDLFESITAAIFLDQGDAAVDLWLQETLLRDDIFEVAKQLNINYKNKFQELLQPKSKEDITYFEIDRIKKADNTIDFHMGVRVDGMIYGRGIGKTKKEASQNAARDALEKLESHNPDRSSEN